MSSAVKRETYSESGISLRLDSIEKSFFGVRVLKGISFEVAAGTTLGLIGENGAGKSTLMNILGGNLKPECGSLYLAGQPYVPAVPRDAERAGIAFVHQELNLFGNLSIAENLFVNAFPMRWGFLDRRNMEKRTAEAMALVGLEVSPRTRVDQLSTGERQLVEIAKALNQRAKLIILDEPTTSLAAKEKIHLFEIIRRLQERGITLIYISHALEDVKALANQIAVLRDGSLVEEGPADRFAASELISLMVGREIDQLFPPRTGEPQREALLKVHGIGKRGVVKGVNFELRQGEVLGIAGLMGSGRTELARILYGIDPMDTGEIWLQGEAIQSLAPRERVARGLAFLTEDRRAEGLMMEASIAENMALASLERHASGVLSWVDRRGLYGEIKKHLQQVGVTATARDEQAVKTLSGGNQQKVVLAKWLMNGPSVVLLDEPTRGIDVGAKYEVYSLINDLTRKGKGVVVISSELEELIGVCDRILVMRKGELVESFDRAAFDREEILKAAL